MRSVQDLQKLDIEFVKKVFPEFGLDFGACDRLQKLKDIDSDFILNSYASVDFDVAKNILEMHCHYSREGSKSATKISSFCGSCDASTVFALFLSRGNFSHFQLSSFLSLHPGREAWVSHSEGKSEATFVFAAQHDSPSANAVTLPNFFSPAPVSRTSLFLASSAHFAYVHMTLPAQVRHRVQLSFMSVAKRLALVAPSSSEQEYKEKYNDISEMFEKESLLLPCAKYGGELIEKRFALLHRSHVYYHLIKVSTSALAIFAFARSQQLHFADVSQSIPALRTFRLRLFRLDFGLQRVIHPFRCRAQAAIRPWFVTRQPLRSHFIFGAT